MYSDIGPAIEATVRIVFILLVTTIPLAIWKLVDIAIWIFSHLQISWQ